MKLKEESVERVRVELENNAKKEKEAAKAAERAILLKNRSEE